MLELATLKKNVLNEQKLKSDFFTNMRSAVPLARGGDVKLKVGAKTEWYFMKEGLPSYLSKLKINTPFFDRCSDELKGNILREFHTNNARGSILVRTYRDRIRYVASDQYAKFDDVTVVDAFGEVDMPLEIKEFKHTPEFMVLRATTPDPIEIKGLRPFYPGIQIMNSEVGKSSLRLQYILWEQVCTNGMIVEKEMESFSMRHYGKPSVEKMVEAMGAMNKNFTGFVDASAKKLKAFSTVGGKILFERLKSDPRIPRSVVSVLHEFTTKAIIDAGEAGVGALDVMSKFTNEVQKFNWSERTYLESIAGGLLWKGA